MRETIFLLHGFLGMTEDMVAQKVNYLKDSFIIFRDYMVTLQLSPINCQSQRLPLVRLLFMETMTYKHGKSFKIFLKPIFGAHRIPVIVHNLELTMTKIL